MAQSRIYKQPQRGRRDQEPEDQSTGLTNPSGQTYQRPSGGSVYDSNADADLSDIDKVLADSEANNAASRKMLQEQSSPAASDLRSREDQFGAPSTPQQGAPSLFKQGTARADSAGSTLAPGALKDAEGGANAEKGLYKAAGIDSEFPDVGGLRAKLAGISRRRKIAAAGGVGGVTGLIIALMLITPIYRLPALMTDLEHKVGQEVDHIVERRAERIIVRYLIAKAGGDTTDYVITGSPLSDLWRTFQSRRLEKIVADRTGITFKKGGDGIVRVFHDGTDLGDGRTAEKAMAIIERGTIENKADFKVILKLVTNFHTAGNVARSLKLRFLKGTPYGAPPVDEQAKSAEAAGKETAEQVAKKEVEDLTAQQIEVDTAGDIGEFGDAMTCTFDREGCGTFQEEAPDAAVPDPASEAAQQDLKNGSSDVVKTTVEDAAQETEKEVVKDREKGFIKTVFEKILTKVIGTETGKLATKVAIIGIGWIDLAATLQHMIGNFFANDLAHAIPVILRENGYGAIYSSWVGYSDQTKAGRMPLAMLAALTEQLGGSHGASTYGYMSGKGTNTGVAVDPKVGSNTFSESGNLINEVYNNILYRITVRGPLELWYYTIGKVIGLIGTGITDLLGFLINISGIGAAFSATLNAIFGPNWQVELAQFAVKVILDLYGIAIDPLAKGAAMFNNIFTGGTVAMNYYCHLFLGCRTLTQKQGVLINMQLQEKDNEDMASMPLSQRLFSLNTPNSLTNNLVRDAPTSMKPSDVMASLFAQVAKLPSSILSAFSPKLRAAEVDDVSKMTGVQMYGATETDLNQDTAPEVRQQSINNVNCPKTDPSKEFNACEADTTTMNGLNCWLGTCPEWGE